LISLVIVKADISIYYLSITIKCFFWFALQHIVLYLQKQVSFNIIWSGQNNITRLKEEGIPLKKIKFIEEFKQFALRGNVIDLAVAVIIGNAINKIVSSLVINIFTPIISFFIGRIDIKSLAFIIKSSLTGGATITIGYGNFLQSVLDFLTTAFCIFIMLKMLNKLHDLSFRKVESEPEETKPEAPKTEELLIEIRDLLQEQMVTKGRSDLPDDLDQKHWHHTRQSQKPCHCDTPATHGNKSTGKRTSQINCCKCRKPRGSACNKPFECLRGTNEHDYYAAGKRRSGNY
jgi:large conductance mechanosensitive channel